MPTIRNNFLLAVQTDLEKNIFYHSLSLEACMGGLYDYFQNTNSLDSNEPKKEDWLLAGLVHDIDYTPNLKATHPSKTKEALAIHNLSISDTIDQIVKAHGWHYPGGIEPKTKAQWSIFCADSLTGLIVAVALVYPTKKLVDVKLSSVTKRFLKEPRFAAGTRREDVSLCQKPEGLNLSLEIFIEICLKSMQIIASEIGL